MKNKTLITGIAGQDGCWLTELLLEKGHEVYGILRRHSKCETQDERLIEFIPNFDDRVKTYYGDMVDAGSLHRIIEEVKPDWIFNLAAQSHVGISFQIPEYTTMVNAMGFLNLLEAVRNIVPKCKVYQASSSEVFGNQIDKDGFQRMTTSMLPVSPYGNSKLHAFNSTKIYRDAWNLFISNGLLFNHESKMRGTNFVTAKIVKTAVEIKYGIVDKLELGNLDVRRDFSHSRDMCRAMIKILEQDKPNDYLLASGQNHSVREICNIVFSKLSMNYKDYVNVNLKFIRPNELMELKGYSEPYRKMLDWEPEYTFEQIFEEMVEYYEEKIIEKHKISNVFKLDNVDKPYDFVKDYGYCNHDDTGSPPPEHYIKFEGNNNEILDDKK